MSMIHILLFFWILSAVFVVKERKIVRLIIYLGIFASISAGGFLLLGSPDVAMAGVILGVFYTIIFIVCFEKYYDLAYSPETAPAAMPTAKKKSVIKSFIAPACFIVFLIVLFINFMPTAPYNDYLRNLYITMFKHDFGGENAVTAIYLGYRMFDTLLEALVLLVSILAVIHLSWHKDITAEEVKQSDVSKSEIAVVTIRFICPVLILVSIYLILNGHISPGGGFHGGVVAASFFVCRYMIYQIYDIRVDKIVTLEKLIYTAIVLVAIFFVFMTVEVYLPVYQTMYLMLMNLLIGLKVACGFLIIFYRFIALERS